MVLWLGGMFTFSIIGASTNGEEAANLRGLFAKIVTPSMLATWAAGLSLATLGGWFEIAAWPFAKIAGAFVLSGVHGMVAGCLTHRAAEKQDPDEKQEPDILLWAVSPTLLVISMVSLIFVATTKLF